MKLLLFTTIVLTSAAALYVIFFTSTVDKLIIYLTSKRASGVIDNLEAVKTEAVKRKGQLSKMKQSLDEEVKAVDQILPSTKKQNKTKQTRKNEN